MRYFMDTEFVELGSTKPLQLLSVAIVSEHDGREFYAQNVRCYPDSDFVREHVWPHLDNLRWWHERDGDSVPWWEPEGITAGIREWLSHDPAPEFWGYYADYDWVVLCQLFGDMSALPQGWPFYCRDLRQSLDAFGLTDVRQPDDAPHHALSDARWIRDTFATWIAPYEVTPDEIETIRQRVMAAVDRERMEQAGR